MPATLFDKANESSSWTKSWQCLGHRHVIDFSVFFYVFFALSLLRMALTRSEMCANRWEFVTEKFSQPGNCGLRFCFWFNSSRLQIEIASYCGRQRQFECDLCARRAIIIASIRWPTNKMRSNESIIFVVFHFVRWKMNWSTHWDPTRWGKANRVYLPHMHTHTPNTPSYTNFVIFIIAYGLLRHTGRLLLHIHGPPLCVFAAYFERKSKQYSIKWKGTKRIRWMCARVCVCVRESSLQRSHRIFNEG